ncbi:hypothetical protein EMCRGX_G008329 [Ephydatia muelleri]
MPSRARARRDKNRAEKIVELNENSIEDTERDISMEAQERKKQRDKKRYANDPESKKSYEKARRLENRIIREEDERKKQSDKKGYANDNKKINPWRHSLFEPSASVQGTYKCELNKDNLLLGQLNDAFNKVNPCLAKKVLTRIASEAVAKICTNALVSKALSLRRTHAGLIIKGVHSNALSFSHSNVESWERYHTVGSEPYFYDSSYTPVKHVQAIPVDQHGRCVISKEIGTSNLMSMRPIKWQCASECRQPSKEEIEVIDTTKSLFKMSLDEIRQGLNKIDRGCTLVQQAQATIPDTPDNGKQPRVTETQLIVMEKHLMEANLCQEGVECDSLEADGN